jgi:N-acetylglucosaminyldiphosphoundecaprenol N-acetyl-beta-D-mannosaminyltransferase
VARVNIIGTAVSAIDMRQALATINRWIAGRERHYVCVRDVHGLVQAHRDYRLREIHNRAGLVTPDGMPLVWLCRRAGFDHVDRVYGPDLMLAAFADPYGVGYRHFLYGSTGATVSRLAERLTSRFPHTRVVGTYAPPFREATAHEADEVATMINASGADIVWVGLSTPKQERWMAENRARLDAPVLAGVGAAFDFHSGAKRQAPRFIQRSGFEWLFRLLTEPRRLGRRYLTTIPVFLFLVSLQMLGIRNFPPHLDPPPAQP